MGLAPMISRLKMFAMEGFDFQKFLPCLDEAGNGVIDHLLRLLLEPVLVVDANVVRVPAPF